MPVTYSGPVIAGSLQTWFGHDDGDPTNPETVRAPTPWTQHDAAKAAFLAALTVSESEDFETGFVDDQALPITLTFSTLGTATLTGGGFINRIIPPATNGTGRYGTSGEFYFNTSASADGIVTFSLATITAFGFSGIDIGDFAGQLTVTITFVDLTVETYSPPHMIGAIGASPVAGSIAFVGVIASKPIASFALGNTAATRDVFGYDDFVIAQGVVVPPPGIPAVPAECGHSLAMTPCPPSHCAITVSVAPVAYAAGTVALPSVPSACGHPLAGTPCAPSAVLV